MSNEKRHICWPEFDEVCLEGGCVYCEDHPKRNILVIRDKAEAMGLSAAFEHGEDRKVRR